MAKGRKTGGGSRKGRPNKSTTDIRELAQPHCAAAIAKAVHLMERAESEDTQLRAAQFLIERGYGKAKEYHEHSGNLTMTHRVDRPPEESREAWIERRRSELRLVAAAGSAD